MSARKIDAALRQWIVVQASNGAAPEAVLASVRSRGWPEQDAIDSIESVMRDHLAEHARDHDLPQPCRVPAPIDANGPAIVQALERPVKVLASLRHPNIIVFGDLLSADECEQMLSLAGRHLHRSATYNLDHDAHTAWRRAGPGRRKMGRHEMAAAIALSVKCCR